ncbi:MAG: GNAT family N-acetyltransferase [Christensenellaceae bacterium]|nr:GNAT family N-acetyltransferase [Christensenellaceae bacterium]
MDISLKPAITEDQLFHLEQLYIEAFPAAERKPFPLLLEKSRQGQTELLCMHLPDGEFAGLAIMVVHRGIALLDYFAVSPALRGKGVGSQALHALMARYKGDIFLLEIETTLAPAEDAAIRLSRKNFYLRAGLTPLPWEIVLFGVRMEVLTDGTYVEFDDYHRVYRDNFGEDIAKKITLFEK